MTSEQERWAFAAKLLEMHGDRIGAYVAERANHFLEHGNQDALVFWEDVSAKLMQLMGPEDGSKPQ